MKYRKLGNLEVSAVGLGCMGMTHAYGRPADKREMRELIAEALDGMSMSAVYGGTTVKK